MKLNWGTAITIAIIAFMGFILFMVYLACSTKPDLQAEDYYAQEIVYQSKINALRHGNPFKAEIDIIQVSDSITIRIPEELDPDNGELTIHFFRPNDASLDRTFILQRDLLYLDRNEFVPGVYTYSVNWNQNGALYTVDKPIEIIK